MIKTFGVCGLSGFQSNETPNGLLTRQPNASGEFSIVTLVKQIKLVI